MYVCVFVDSCAVVGRLERLEGSKNLEMTFSL